jgi:hypothetical protein
VLVVVFLADIVTVMAAGTEGSLKRRRSEGGEKSFELQVVERK